MSMILNDEQERALREWIRSSTGPDGIAHLKTDADLIDALMPLVRPWRVTGPFDHQVVRHDATNRSVEVKCFGNNMRDYQGLAQRICDLLNESEARK